MRGVRGVRGALGLLYIIPIMQNHACVIVIDENREISKRLLSGTNILYISYEMTMRVRFCLLYDHLNGILSPSKWTYFQVALMPRRSS